MCESDGEAVRIEELLGVLEQSAKAHWNAPDKASADRALERWYSALREIGCNKETCASAARAAAAGSSN